MDWWDLKLMHSMVLLSVPALAEWRLAWELIAFQSKSEGRHFADVGRYTPLQVTEFAKCSCICNLCCCDTITDKSNLRNEVFTWGGRVFLVGGCSLSY